MLSNLTKEIFIYSLIPAAVLVFIVLLLLLVGKKKNDNFFKYNYFIKILLLLIIGLVLPLIVGYTIWVFERFMAKNLLSSNMFYVILLIVLDISLVVLLIVICRKLFKSFKSREEQLS